MNTRFTVAAPLATPGTLRKDKREPAIIPDPIGEMFPYVLRLKEKCPVEQVFIFGQNVPKFVIPMDASLVENRGKMIFPRKLVRLLSENQAKAIRERAKITPIEVRNHPDFKEPDGDRIPDYFGYAAEWLVCCRVEEDNDYTVVSIVPEKDTPLDKQSQLKKELVEEQVERGELKGKKRDSRK